MGAVVGGLCAALAIGSAARAAVEIHTADGRVLAGEVDSRTTADHLWVRQESDGIILATPVRWSSIASAWVDGEPTDVAQLSDRSDQLASETRFGFLREPSGTGSFVRSLRSKKVSVPLPGRITSLEIDAVLVNLDRDVEPDGYELVIAAVDVHGQSVPVKGNLYVRLMGERNVHHTGRIRFEDLQQWNQPVAPHDFIDGVAAYVLPFRALNPEFDDELRLDAQLNVRLGVFGEGNFAATVPVPLRQFSPYRDRLQMFEGSRFFRDELSGRVRHLDNHTHGIYRRAWSR